LEPGKLAGWSQAKWQVGARGSTSRSQAGWPKGARQIGLWEPGGVASRSQVEGQKEPGEVTSKTSEMASYSLAERSVTATQRSTIGAKKIDASRNLPFFFNRS
jgi:hypothetical protein